MVWTNKVEKIHRFGGAMIMDVFSLTESLEGVESLIVLPATMTHAAMPKAERDARGVVDGLVGLSFGIGDVQDLVEDLEYALTQLLAQDSVTA